MKTGKADLSSLSIKALGKNAAIGRAISVGNVIPFVFPGDKQPHFRCPPGTRRGGKWTDRLGTDCEMGGTRTALSRIGKRIASSSDASSTRGDLPSIAKRIQLRNQNIRESLADKIDFGDTSNRGKRVRKTKPDGVKRGSLIGRLGLSVPRFNKNKERSAAQVDDAMRELADAVDFKDTSELGKGRIIPGWMRDWMDASYRQDMETTIKIWEKLYGPGSGLEGYITKPEYIHWRERDRLKQEAKKAKRDAKRKPKDERVAAAMNTVADVVDYGDTTNRPSAAPSPTPDATPAPTPAPSTLTVPTPSTTTDPTPVTMATPKAKPKPDLSPAAAATEASDDIAVQKAKEQAARKLPQRLGGIYTVLENAKKRAQKHSNETGEIMQILEDDKGRFHIIPKSEDSKFWSKAGYKTIGFITPRDPESKPSSAKPQTRKLPKKIDPATFKTPENSPTRSLSWWGRDRLRYQGIYNEGIREVREARRNGETEFADALGANLKLIRAQIKLIDAHIEATVSAAEKAKG